MAQKAISKRDFIKAGIAMVSTISLAGCGSAASCFKPEETSAGNAFARSSRNYVNKSSQSDKRCGNCALFNGARDNACGTCQIDDLPASPDGYCDSWSRT